MCATPDLFVLVCGLVAENSTHGLLSRMLLLVTWPQAHTDKSVVTLEWWAGGIVGRGERQGNE